MKLESFRVDTVVVHDIPHGNAEGQAPILTDAPIELDDDLRGYFQRKIVSSLREGGVEVVADENEDDTVRAAVATIIGA
jgi:hypothetical protein